MTLTGGPKPFTDGGQEGGGDNPGPQDPPQQVADPAQQGGLGGGEIAGICSKFPFTFSGIMAKRATRRYSKNPVKSTSLLRR